MSPDPIFKKWSAMTEFDWVNVPDRSPREVTTLSVGMRTPYHSGKPVAATAADDDDEGRHTFVCAVLATVREAQCRVRERLG